MSSAFDTIKNEHQLDIVNRIANDDVTRMIKTLISKTTPGFKNGGDAEKIPFEINMSSPQKDGLSCTAFDCYCENALVGVREEIKERIDGKQDQTYCCPSIYQTKQSVQTTLILSAIPNKIPLKSPNTFHQFS